MEGKGLMRGHQHWYYTQGYAHRGSQLASGHTIGTMICSPGGLTWYAD